MARKRHKPEEIIAKLCQVEVMSGQGALMAEAMRSIGGDGGRVVREDILSGAIFTRLREVQFVIENRPPHDNKQRTHSPVGGTVPLHRKPSSHLSDAPQI